MRKLRYFLGYFPSYFPSYFLGYFSSYFAITIILSACGSDGGSGATIGAHFTTPKLSIEEGLGGETAEEVTFNANLSDVSNDDVTFKYIIKIGAGDTALPTDFNHSVELNTEIEGTIIAGSRKLEIVVRTVNNDTIDGNKTFSLVFSNVIGAVFEPARTIITITGTIIDDDFPTLSVEESAGSEKGSIIFSVNLSDYARSDVAFKYRIEAGTALPADFASTVKLDTEIDGMIATEGSTLDIVVEIEDDSEHEVYENFSLVLSEVTGAVFDPAGTTLIAIGTIIDDDIPRLSVEASTGGEKEGITFNLMLDKDSIDGVSFKYRIAAGTALPADFAGTIQVNTEIAGMIAIGTRTLDIFVEIEDDILVEEDEDFSLVLSEVKGAIFEPAGSTLIVAGTVISDDVPLSIVANTGGEGTGEVSFTVSLDKALDEDVTFTYGTSISGTDTAEREDFVEIAGMLMTISAGSVVENLAVSINADGELEGDETFSLTLSYILSEEAVFEPAGSTLTVVGTIIDSADANGNGLLEINNPAEMNNIRYNVNGTSYKTSATDTGDASNCPIGVCNGYELMDNMDLRAAGNWEPIQGQSDNNAYNSSTCAGNPSRIWNGTRCVVPSDFFTAIFDGNNYTISNLNISSDTNSVGLFGIVSGTLRNFKLRDGSIVGIRSVGAVAGYLESTGKIENVSSDLNVIGSNNVGGLVGESFGNIQNSNALGDVNGDSGVDYVGGLVGESSSGSIRNSYTIGYITASGSSSRVGGLVGETRGNIYNSYALGNVVGGDGGSNYVGGLVGAGYGIIFNSYSLGNVEGGAGDNDNVGRIVGTLGGSASVYGNYYIGVNTLEGKNKRAIGIDEAVGKTKTQLKALTATRTESDFTGNGWSTNDWNFTTGKYPSLKSYKVDGSDVQVEGDLLCTQGVDWNLGDEWVQC